MVDVLWWLQATGAAFSVLLTAGALGAAAYTTIRDTPMFFRRLTGTHRVERRLDRLHADHKLAQELALQQAESFNELKAVVCEQHDIPESERPNGMNTALIREELLGRDELDFTRGRGSTRSD